MTPRRHPWLALTASLLAVTCKPTAPPNPTPLPNPNALPTPNALPNPNATPTPTPIAARSAPELDTSCREDADCVPAPDCCPAPCTSDVINVKELPRAQKALESCPKDRVCPNAGACVTQAYLCITGKCALVMQGNPAYHAR
jgi:hypothetical protein